MFKLLPDVLSDCVSLHACFPAPAQHHSCFSLHGQHHTINTGKQCPFFWGGVTTADQWDLPGTQSVIACK